jgi:MFS family permease
MGPPAGAGPVPEPGTADAGSALDVFRNRPFLLLWLSQVFTQIGANMVLFGLTVIVLESTRSNTAVSLLILSFLAPAVLFSAVAGVYVDRFDKRLVLVATNILRALMFVILWFVGDFLLLLLLLNAAISTVTVFFAPAEASMIPQLVPRKQLVTANGVFTLTLNAAFAVGYALLGSIVVTLAGAPGLILVVAAFYLVAALFCWWLPPAPPVVTREAAVHQGLIDPEAEQAIGSTVDQLREGIGFIRGHRSIGWALAYLGIAASLVGVLGVLGPDFAQESLGLEPKDFAVVVLPLAFGIVTGILVLNSWGHLLPRRRIIEGGLIALGIFVFLIVGVGPLSRLLQTAEEAAGLVSLADFTSLLSLVVFIALLAGVAYAFVAIPSQTQLQEEIPTDVRGRVFGVLNMLISTASLAPIVIVGPLSDLVGTTNVLYAVAIAITASGIISIVRRGPLKPAEARQTATGPTTPAGLDPVAVVTATEMEAGERRAALKASHAPTLPDGVAATGADASPEPDGGEPVPPAEVDVPWAIDGETTWSIEDEAPWPPEAGVAMPAEASSPVVPPAKRPAPGAADAPEDGTPRDPLQGRGDPSEDE